MKAKFTLITLLAGTLALSSCDLGYTFIEGALGIEPGTISETEQAFKDIKKDIKDIKKDFKDVKNEVKGTSKNTDSSPKNNSSTQTNVIRTSVSDGNTNSSYNRKKDGRQQ